MKPKSKSANRITQSTRVVRRYLDKRLWEPMSSEGNRWEHRLRNLLRVGVICVNGMKENGLFSRAAGLSYGALMAMGPLIAIAVWISGAFVQTDAETQIKKLLLFVSPSLNEYLVVEEAANGNGVGELDNLINQVVSGAQNLVEQINLGGSKAFGTFGAVLLIWLSIQLMTTIETTLNRIWGVSKGRPWGQRIITYWSFISLGAVLGLGSTALVSASNLAMFFEWVPFGSALTPFFIALTPVLSYLMLVALLCLFYMFFPHIRVQFKPALIGAAVAAILLIANNYLSILYIHRVVSLQSLYGSLGIIIVLMFGMYLFWVFILLGGQLSFAVQNLRFLSDQQTWKRLSPLSRELLVLAVFLNASRRFARCERAPSNEEIADQLHAPVNAVNESVSILRDFGWLSPVQLTTEEGRDWTGYQPSIPLDKITLAEFHQRFGSSGNNDPGQRLADEDEILRRYRSESLPVDVDPFFQRSIKELIDSEES
ncbi:MAG: YihY/virulence factor BrkB family protein [Opitutales bacterium]|nr:YihY/virulence factor BrkB family protein [Opitutales bacterium]